MNQTKVILFDVDGVLIRPPNYFSAELEKVGYQNAAAIMNEYYENENDQCLIGNLDTIEAIKPYLAAFSWKSTPESYIRNQFEFEGTYLDSILIGLIAKFRSENIKCYIATDQEKFRAKFLLNNLNFRNTFDGHFISCNIGYRKRELGFWEHLMKTLESEFPGIKPHEIIFIDDIQEHVNIASGFGIRSILFTDFDSLKAEITS